MNQVKAPGWDSHRDLRRHSKGGGNEKPTKMTKKDGGAWGMRICTISYLGRLGQKDGQFNNEQLRAINFFPIFVPGSWHDTQGGRI